MIQIIKTDFFQICTALGSLLVGMAIGIYLLDYFRSTEGLLLILGVTVYNVGTFGIYFIKDAEGKKALRQTYLSRLLVWVFFALILSIISWVAKLF